MPSRLPSNMKPEIPILCTIRSGARTLPSQRKSSCPPNPSIHPPSSLVLFAMANASGGKPFTNTSHSFTLPISSPSRPASSSLSTLSARLCKMSLNCWSSELASSLVLLMIWEVVEVMAARWSRTSGGSELLRMEETRDWMEGIKESVRDSRKCCVVVSFDTLDCLCGKKYLQIIHLEFRGLVHAGSGVWAGQIGNTTCDAIG